MSAAMIEAALAPATPTMRSVLRGRPARLGAHALQVLVESIGTISDETCDRFNPAGEEVTVDGRDYPQMLDALQVALGRLDREPEGYRIGFLMALAELLCFIADSCSPGDDWRPLAAVVDAMALAESGKPAGQGRASADAASGEGGTCTIADPDVAAAVLDLLAEASSSHPDGNSEVESPARSAWTRLDAARRAAGEIEMLSHVLRREVAFDNWEQFRVVLPAMLRRLLDLNSVVLSVVGGDCICTTLEMLEVIHSDRQQAELELAQARAE